WPEALSPPFDPGTVNNELVSFIDLAPTVLSLAGVTVPVHMQGRILLGPGAEPAPEYVFAARDRMDIEYDMRRSARDERFLYIRNCAPESPYAGYMPYRISRPSMQELTRPYPEVHPTGSAPLWWQNPRPAEERYDPRADPARVHRLASG